MGLFDKVTGVLSGGASADLFVDLETTQIKKGGELACTFKISPKTNFKVRSIRFDLDSTEKSTATVSYRTKNDSGSKTGTDTTRIYHGTKQFSAEKEFQEGFPFEDKFSITIPADGQPTYHGNNASHEWTLKLVLDIAMGMDLSKTVSFTVD